MFIKIFTATLGMLSLTSVAFGNSLCTRFAFAPDTDLVQVTEPLVQIYGNSGTKPSPEQALEMVKAMLSPLEVAMVQTTLLANWISQPLSPDEALMNFFDLEHDGNLGGLISYLKMPDSGTLFARTEYYPGDNEYGAIFIIHTSGPNSAPTASLIGTIEDSDVYCLSFQDAPEA